MSCVDDLDGKLTLYTGLRWVLLILDYHRT